MSDLNAPATKQDVREIRQAVDEIRHEIEKLGVKVDAYWLAAQHVQRLAYGLLAAGVITVMATAATLILRGA